MPLIVDLCHSLRPQGGSAQQAALPVILTAAHQQGLKIAGLIQSIIHSWPQQSVSTSKGDISHSTSVALAWAAVQCLPHADSNPQHSIKLLQGLIAATETALTSLPSDGTDLASSHAQELLFLQCYARGTLASLSEAHAPEQLQQQAGNALAHLYRHPHNFHVIRCAAEVVTLAKKAGSVFPSSQLQVRRHHLDWTPMHSLLVCIACACIGVTSTYMFLLSQSCCCSE